VIHQQIPLSSGVLWNKRVSRSTENFKGIFASRQWRKISGNVWNISYLHARWRIWLRYWATWREAAGSIPDVFTIIFYLHNSFSRTMALRSTQPLTEMGKGKGKAINVSFHVICLSCSI
jgi:hypothetical protein